MTAKTGFLFHERYMWHITGVAAGSLPAGGFLEPDLLHLESPPAKRRFRNLVEVSGLLDKLTSLRPRPATEGEVTRIHDPGYLSRLRALSEAGHGDAGEYAPVGPNSWEIALLSAGGCLAAAEAILAGTVRNAYALVRPPGHHAERDRGRGFCLLANGAIVAAHLRNLGLERVAIVDWDVHHGNGAQSIFYADPSVLTVSLHQDGWYPPDSGTVSEAGTGEGYGFNINVPLPPGSGNGAYVAAIKRVVLPALRAFRPEMIIVSSGFDACAFDPFGRQMATAATYAEMTKLLMAAADDICAGRLLMVHEGGYSTFYAPWCGLATVETLSGIKTEAEDPYAFAIDWPGQLLQPAQDAAIEAAVQTSRLVGS